MGQAKQKALMKNLLNTPEQVNRPKSFLKTSLAVGLISQMKGEEEVGNARWNRLNSAEDAILKVCDIYLPDGMNTARLATIYDILDGPVEAVFDRHWHILMDAALNERVGASPRPVD